MKVDFNKLKSEISLPDLLLHFGWSFAPGTSSAAVKMTNGTDVYIIKKNKQGHQTYWDLHGTDRGKSCLDFMQKELLNQTGKMPSLREVGEALQNFLNNHDIVTTNNSAIKVTDGSLDRNQLVTLLHELKPYSGNFLEKRGIKPEILDSPVFKDVFYSRRYKVLRKDYYNTCVKLQNASGFQGISQRAYDENGNSFKGIKGNKYGSIAISNYDSSRPIDLILVGESMIDNASHYQMKLFNTKQNVLYISTEGNITQGQIELIDFLLSHNNVTDIANQLMYIFDNDHNGYKYAIKLDTYLKEKEVPKIEHLTADEVKELALNLPNIDLPTLKDWNEDLNVGITSNNDKRFVTSILHTDYNELVKLQLEGYRPSLSMLDTLEPYYSKDIRIAITKIFELPINQKLNTSELSPLNISPTVARKDKIENQSITI